MELEEAFSKFHISEKWRLLDDVKERTPCPKCKKSRKYFCYTCYIPVSNVKDIIPRVSLPIKIDIIKHRREIDGKSTSAHAAILAPNHVTVYQYPDEIPSYSNDGKTVIIYPGKNSCSVGKYFQDNPILVSSLAETEVSQDCDKCGRITICDKILKLPFERAVFIDGTWNQSKAMYNSIESLPSIVLQSRASQFWRHQKNSPRWYLATIEAIHQWLNEIHQQCLELIDLPKENFSTEYDDLLFFFRYMYHIIHSFYDHNDLLSYRRPLNL